MGPIRNAQKFFFHKCPKFLQTLRNLPGSRFMVNVLVPWVLWHVQRGTKQRQIWISYSVINKELYILVHICLQAQTKCSLRRYFCCLWTQPIMYLECQSEHANLSICLMSLLCPSHKYHQRPPKRQTHWNAKARLYWLNLLTQKPPEGVNHTHGLHQAHGRFIGSL